MTMDRPAPHDVDTTERSPQADLTPASSRSLRELQADLLQRAAVTALRARSMRCRGELHGARRLEARAAELRRIAMTMDLS